LPAKLAKAGGMLHACSWLSRQTDFRKGASPAAPRRLESLLNFQTMVTDLTGMQLSNSSLLDEGTAAAEAMTMCSALARGKKTTFLVSVSHPYAAWRMPHSHSQHVRLWHMPDVRHHLGGLAERSTGRVVPRVQLQGPTAA